MGDFALGTFLFETGQTLLLPNITIARMLALVNAATSIFSKLMALLRFTDIVEGLNSDGARVARWQHFITVPAFLRQFIGLVFRAGLAQMIGHRLTVFALLLFA